MGNKFGKTQQPQKKIPTTHPKKNQKLIPITNPNEDENENQIKTIKNKQISQSMLEKIEKQRYFLVSQKLNLSKQCVCSVKCKEWKYEISRRKLIQVHSLFLGQCQIDSINFLTDTSIHWKNLAILYLNNNKITALQIKPLLTLQWQILQYLNMSENNIGSSGVKLLTKVDMPKLERLHLSGCNLGYEGVKHLGKGKWKMIQQFYLNDNNISLDGYEAVRQGDYPQLNWLGISNHFQLNKSNFDDSICVITLVTANLPIIEILVKIRNGQIKADVIKVMSASKMKGLGW